MELTIRLALAGPQLTWENIGEINWAAVRAMVSDAVDEVHGLRIGGMNEMTLSIEDRDGRKRGTISLLASSGGDDVSVPRGTKAEQETVA